MVAEKMQIRRQVNPFSFRKLRFVILTRHGFIILFEYLVFFSFAAFSCSKFRKRKGLLKVISTDKLLATILVVLIVMSKSSSLILILFVWKIIQRSILVKKILFLLCFGWLSRLALPKYCSQLMFTFLLFFQSAVFLQVSVVKNLVPVEF